MNTKKIFPTTAINIVCNQINALLKGVNVNPIPSGPFAPIFTEKFENFRNTAIKTSQCNPTLNSAVEALTLNGIAIFGENTWNDYELNHSEMGEMLIAFKNEYLEGVDDVAVNQSHLANTYIRDFSQQCKTDVGEIDGFFFWLSIQEEKPFPRLLDRGAATPKQRSHFIFPTAPGGTDTRPLVVWFTTKTPPYEWGGVDCSPGHTKRRRLKERWFSREIEERPRYQQ
ncbi:unnamed protein product [Mucor hiemalis]